MNRLYVLVIVFVRFETDIEIISYNHSYLK
jgi:hypothetical protein